MEDPATPTTRRSCWTRSGRATWSTVGPRTRMTRPLCRAGARSASRRSKMPARSIPSGWRRWTTKFSTLPLKFVDKAKADGKPFFVWLNPTRMHIVTHLSDEVSKRCATRRMAGPFTKPAWPRSTTSSAIVMKKLKDMGVDDNTIVMFTTDNGTETFTWPDGGQHAVPGSKRARSMKAVSACRR